MIDNILKDNSVVTDIAGDYTLVKTKNPTIAFQLVKLGFKLNEHDSFEKNNLDQEDRLKTIKNFSVHDKFHRTLILSGFCLLKIAKISLNSSFFPKPIKR